MIKSYTIATTEVDNANIAAEEICKEIANIQLLANTICVISAHPEYLTSGAYEKVAKSLPFPSVGMTTILNSVNNTIDSYMLSLMILTSDDCNFACALSDPLDLEKGIGADVTRKCYENTSAQLANTPKAALLYTPFSVVPPQHEYIAGIHSVNPALPVFGVVANDNQGTSTKKNMQSVLFNGEVHTDKLAMILISGNVNPKFYIASLPEDSIIMPNIGVITETRGSKILSINNINSTKFLRNAGFITSESNDHNVGLLSSIFVMHLKNETGGEYNVSRIPLVVDDEGVVCGGQLTIGSMLSIAFNTKDSVLQTARKLMNTIKENHESGTVLIHSCMGRRFPFLSDPFGEFEVVRDALSQNFNYILGYSSGEICPLAFSDGGIKNLELNQVLIACVL